MSELEPLSKYKKLYHDDGWSIVEKSVTKTDATIVLSDGNSRTTITDDSEEFLHAAQNIAQTVREGKTELIDLEAVPAGDKSSFLSVGEYFNAETENPIQTAIHKINRGESNPPTDIDIFQGLEASISYEFQNEYLLKLVRNYYEFLGIQLSHIKNFNDLIQEFRMNNAYNTGKFDSYFSDVLSILANAHRGLSPIESFRLVCDQRTDFDFLSQKMLNVKRTNNQQWEALRNAPPSLQEGDTPVRYRDMKRMDGTHSDKTAEIPANIAIKRMLKQYSEKYELLREPFHDIAVALDPPASLNLESDSRILDFLHNDTSQNLTEPIVRELRHGPSHMSTEIDSDEQVVRIYNNRRQDRIVDQSFIFDEIPEYYYAISDLLIALSHGIILHAEHILYQYLGSDDFQYKIMENVSPDWLE